MADHWQRPASIDFPQIWKRFETINRSSGEFEKFWIQDIPETLYETVIQMMTIHFYAYEPIRICSGFLGDLVSVAEEQELWRRALKQRLSLVVFIEKANGINEIAGIYINCRRAQNDHQPVYTGAAMKKLTSLANYIIDKNNFYEQFNITEMAISIGIVIFPEYDSRLPYSYMLECRAQLCRLSGIKIMFSLVASESSQKLLANAGFKAYTVMTHQELENIDDRFHIPGIQAFGQCIQLMYKLVATETL